MEHKLEEEKIYTEHYKKCERYAIPEGLPLRKAWAEFEKQYLMKALENNNWHKINTAKELGIHRNSLTYRIKILNLHQLIKKAKQGFSSKKRWVKQ
ncbi:MAG: helix-turn-helix domain-containing protein [Elusimicrobia bacterium]|nr:helix-turn-helix domain-containing protein [Elusimicrobiota bacterium]